MASGKADRAILVCGTGIGMCITANKVKGIRAALCYDELAAKISRQHNDANILALGGRTTTIDLAVRMIDIFLNSSFEGGRHSTRVDKIHSLTGR